MASYDLGSPFFDNHFKLVTSPVVSPTILGVIRAVLATYTTCTFLFIWIWSGVMSDDGDACVWLSPLMLLDSYLCAGTSLISRICRGLGYLHTSVFQHSIPLALREVGLQDSLCNCGGKDFSICTSCCTPPL